MNDLSTSNALKVCFFDSGIGGLTLLYECARKLTGDTKLYYFADNYNVPYGSLPEEELSAKVDATFKKIASLDPAAVVIACNTVTAMCAEKLRSKYSFPIVGIQPAVKQAVKGGNSCAILCTPATAGSKSLKELVQNYGEGRCRVVACPYLASYIEENIFNLDEKELFSLLPDISADAVVLGCTHYAFVQKMIENIYHKPIFNGYEGTSNRLLSVLGKNCGGNSSFKVPDITFCGGDEEKNKNVFFRTFFP
ncbi:MAG: glutamate racemase [Clostridia bacterium]|nr:glutamate racemase [Clostridia bacterium]